MYMYVYVCTFICGVVVAAIQLGLTSEEKHNTVITLRNSKSTAFITRADLADSTELPANATVEGDGE